MSALILSLADVARFWSKVDRSGGPDACWPYLGACFTNGYGAFSLDGQNRKANRIAWTLKHGPIPEGLGALHSCDVRYPIGSKAYRKCCNDAHLFIGDAAANAADMVAKGREASGDRNAGRLYPDRVPRGQSHGRYTSPERTARGERHGSRTHPERILRGERVGTAKLTDDQAEWLRRVVGPGVSQCDAAWLLGVDHSLVSLILRGKCRVVRAAQ